MALCAATQPVVDPFSPAIGSYYVRSTACQIVMSIILHPEAEKLFGEALNFS